MSMFLLEGSSHRSCNLAGECTHVCWLVSLRPAPSTARPCHGFAPLETKSDDPSMRKRVPLPPEPSRVRPCHSFAALETKSDDPSAQNRGGPKSARRYRQSPLDHAPATASRPSRPKVTTIPRKTQASKSARRYHQSPLEYALATVSRPLRPKVTTLPSKTGGAKARAATARAL